MTPVVSAARALIRQAGGRRTLYLVRRPTQSEPEVTLDVPCGQTRAVALGRWPHDALPTDDELAEDIRRALTAMRRPCDRSRPASTISRQSHQPLGQAT